MKKFNDVYSKLVKEDQFPGNKYYATFHVDKNTITLKQLEDGIEVDRHNYKTPEAFKRGILDVIMHGGYKYQVQIDGVFQSTDKFDLVSYILSK